MVHVLISKSIFDLLEIVILQALCEYLCIPAKIYFFENTRFDKTSGEKIIKI